MIGILAPDWLERFFATIVAEAYRPIRFLVFAILMSASFYFVCLCASKLMFRLDAFLAVRKRKAGLSPPEWLYIFGQAAQALPIAALTIAVTIVGVEFVATVIDLLGLSGSAGVEHLADFLIWIRTILLQGG